MSFSGVGNSFSVVEILVSGRRISKMALFCGANEILALLGFSIMARSYTWQKTTDDGIADQMKTIGANTLVEPFRTLLDISPDDSKVWIALAAEQFWLQKTAIPAADALKRAYIAARDGLTHGPDRREYVRPPVPDFTGPVVPSGIVLYDDFYDWANLLVRAWKINPEFTPALQRQMGLEVPSTSDPAPEMPAIRQIKMQSGGVVMVDVFKGGAAGVIVQLNVDNAGWPDVNVGGAFQKTPPGSRAIFQVPAGSAHALQIREAFANRMGQMVGDWSEVKSASSLA